MKRISDKTLYSIVFTFLFALAFPAAAQILWHTDWEAPVGWFSSGVGNPVPPMDTVNVDVGPPHNHVIQIRADATNQLTNSWAAQVIIMPVRVQLVPYDPEHTFLKFQALVSHLRPIHARLEYATFDRDVRNLVIDVMPTRTNVFETFLVRLSDFTNLVYILHGTGINDLMTSLDFSIKGNPSQPDTTWPSASDNLLMLDEIAYFAQPQLTIQSQSPASVLLSWPTNTTDFMLQKSAALQQGFWETLPVSPQVSNGLNTVELPKEPGDVFYRLCLPSP